ncbi:MAG: class II aldolase/adducin family protein, partial [Bacteroidetes bacterium]|nr:class II aldolase/adducin family protein [Bacteroidota bacterium]
MKSKWSNKSHNQFGKDDLGQRVYTSRLIGSEPTLVLHGGGNTSVKSIQRNIFGEKQEIIYVKGSGWDLASIQKPGFAPLKLKETQRLASLKKLSDSDMVKELRSFMTNPAAPNASIEAILHAIIPFKFVDHTHADAIVTITNTPAGKKKIQDIYGNRVLIIPYVMPGFILTQEVHRRTSKTDWSDIDALILMNHGVFTFGETARESYENMIKVVTKGEQYIARKSKKLVPGSKITTELTLTQLAHIRKVVSETAKTAMLVLSNASKPAKEFSKQKQLRSVATKGPLTPDHVIRTKRFPVILNGNPEKELTKYRSDYQSYFDKNHTAGQTMLDPAPRWAVVPGYGSLSFGRDQKEA